MRPARVALIAIDDILNDILKFVFREDTRAVFNKLRNDDCSMLANCLARTPVSARGRSPETASEFALTS